MLWLKEEPAGKAYRKVMEYAMGKSDAFLLSYIYPLANKVTCKRMKSIQDRLAPYLVKRRMDLYWLDTVMIEMPWTLPADADLTDRIRAYEVRPNARAIVRDGIVQRDPKGINCVEIYKASHDALPILYEPGSLYQWSQACGYPDDLSFFKKGICWFHVVGHEKLSSIQNQDADDLAFLNDIGVLYDYAENHPSDSTPYIEDYTL